MENNNNMTDKPVKVDDVDETTVYVASLELRSVGTSTHIFPKIHWSHIFEEEPDNLPHSYRAIIAIAEKIGAIVHEVEPDELEEEEELGDAEDVTKALDAIMKKHNGEGDGTIH